MKKTRNDKTTRKKGQGTGTLTIYIQLRRPNESGTCPLPLLSVYFCGGSCIEDVTTHLMYHLSLHPTLASPTPSARQPS